jgi:3-hydroxyisobutyrate dehydrogenase-like beta-hydroxyacid dehydrogenase
MPAGFGEADLDGKLFIKTRTLRPQTVRDLAPMLHARGATIMDCTVLGTAPAAQGGHLFGLVGAGHAMKLAFNLAMANFINIVGATLDIRTLRKDMQSALAAGASVGAPMAGTAAALTVLSAAVAAGWGDRDIGDIAPFIRDALTQRF